MGIDPRKTTQEPFIILLILCCAVIGGFAIVASLIGMLTR